MRTIKALYQKAWVLDAPAFKAERGGRLAIQAPWRWRQLDQKLELPSVAT